MKNLILDSATGDRILTANDLMSMFSISSTTLWRHVNSGDLPKPLYLGKRRYWMLSDVLSCITTN